VIKQHAPVKLSRGGGAGAVAKGRVYLRDGGWLEAAKVKRFRGARVLPADLQGDEKWVHVDTRSQTLVLYRGGKPVFFTLISSGKPSSPTPRGEFRVVTALRLGTMDADGREGQAAYSKEYVPFVLYFKGSYALHTSYWHSMHGIAPASHGCANLSYDDARVLWDLLDVPEGFAGAQYGKKGMRVVIE